jgi:hypothetical protein
LGDLQIDCAVAKLGECLLNIFYAEPEGDRWFPFDRYPRRVIRQVMRGKRAPGGMERYFLNLRDGLERTKIPFRTNAFHHLNRHPEAVAGIVGKGHLLRRYRWRNPIIFGPAVFSHPIDDPEVFEDLPIKMVLVSCEWMKKMYENHLDIPIVVWAAGIDTYTWIPALHGEKTIDVLIYDKIRWERGRYERDLIEPILSHLHRCGLKYQVIRYGFYREEEYQELLRKCRCMIFLVEHETQGFAYLQALSSGVPILAWDRGGTWQDPLYFPDKVIFEPVTSVPYWDERCGCRFYDADDFAANWQLFWDGVEIGSFKPRDYVLENLTLEESAQKYLKLTQQFDSVSQN